MKNGVGLSLLRARRGRAWGLPVLFLLLAVATVKADTSGDFVYTINANGTIRIDEYTNTLFSGPVTVPSNIVDRAVVGIGRYAFSSCAGLTSVTIPDSVIYIEEYAFNECIALAGVTIGRGVTSIGFRVFDYCTNLTAITVDALNPAYSDLAGVLFNQNQTTLIKCPEGKTGTYTIPNSVTNIGEEAFMSGAKLTSVTIPDSVTRLGDSAFWGCTALAGVTIGNSVASIGEYAFYECTRLTSITIPGSVTRIGSGAFVRCTSLTAITVDALNTAYSSLDGVLFNKDQTTLVQCPGGKAGIYTIPNSVTRIGEEAFYWCTSLTGATIPSSVTTIGMHAFHYCTNLTDVTIPGSVTNLGYFAFANCTRLAGVTIPNSITSIGYWVFNGCTSLTGVTIPNSVTNIGTLTFGGCTGLASITIPSSVISIEDSAFWGCASLARVTIGSGVTRIGNYAFETCTALTGAYFRGNAPSAGSDVFSGTDAVTVYYLPSTAGWEPTFCGRPTAQWNALPEPIIQANGITGDVIVHYPEAVSITVEMFAGNYAGVNVDWWIVACTGSSWFNRDRMAGWIREDNWRTWHPVYQGALGHVPATEVLNIRGLPPGLYTFYFAVDYPMDGMLNLGGPILAGFVNVIVR